MRLKILLSITLALLPVWFTSVSQAQARPERMVSSKGQILIIVTNHSRYPTRTDQTGLWLTELTHFTDVVEAAGYSTVLASPNGGKTPLDERSLGWFYMDDAARQHLKSPQFRLRLASTVPVTQIDPTPFRAIYFTGGHGVMWDFPDNPLLQRAAETIYAQGGIVSAVCHGVVGLVGVKDGQGQLLIKDKAITGFSNREELLAGTKSQVPFFLEDRLVGQGARYQKAWLPFTSYVLTDGRLVTGQNPQSAAAVAQAVVGLLNEEHVHH